MITIPASEIDLSTGGYVGLLVVVPVTYFAVLHWAFGQTLGKRLVGIEVRTADGSRINGGEALIRAVAQATLAITIIGFPFDSLWPLSDNRNQALHDKIVGTVVVRRRAEQIRVPSTTA